MGTIVQWGRIYIKTKQQIKKIKKDSFPALCWHSADDKAMEDQMAVTSEGIFVPLYCSVMCAGTITGISTKPIYYALPWRDVVEVRR